MVSTPLNLPPFDQPLQKSMEHQHHLLHNKHLYKHSNHTQTYFQKFALTPIYRLFQLTSLQFVQSSEKKSRFNFPNSSDPNFDTELDRKSTRLNSSHVKISY